MDEYEHLTDTQWVLFDRMSGISEDCYCAGWRHDARLQRTADLPANPE